MKRRISIGILIILLLGLPGSVFAEGEAGRYYSETGHTLAGEFVDYFDNHGGLRLLGYPITEAFVDPWSGLLIQYTQNSRLELYPDPVTDSMQVRLKELGVLLVGDESKVIQQPVPAGSTTDCQFYPLTGHHVCFAFLDFYIQNGGTQLFGYPITDFVIENDRLVQYFQGFRLDWHPGNPQGNQVKVAPLGRLHFEVMGYDPDLLRPRAPSNVFTYQVFELQPKASVEKPIVAYQDSQEVFVVVRDQNLLPVQGAAVTLVAHFPDETRTLLMPPTDATGASRLTIDFSNQTPGTEINLEFYVSSGTVLTRTRDSFRVWW